MIEQAGAVGGLFSSAVTDALKGAGSASNLTNAKAGNFADVIGQVLDSANAASAKSEAMGKRLQMDDPTASVEETVIAMNTSSLQFTALVQARNKILQAYNDIMNMPV